ncbi:GNAT family N-acetyltransferase [Paenibacillus xylaniclasticus]|uniref:GNAT family N-acetyltransferase n=1 Tax=Paenibacillus xylaniclasticus TaxID=588083 RepID=UPI000FDA11B8|nr:MULTISPECIES: GNAT family N-acetyltransferase [Paenibacillus]GFN31710.1 putative N-acetyltransferase YesJ [Paenibacillus curdlanolyticus]
MTVRFLANFKKYIIKGDIFVSQAEESDTAAVMTLLVQTAEWLSSKGSAQWGALLSGEDQHNTAQSIKNGDVYLFRERDTLAGTVTILRHPSEWDIRLWDAEGHEGAVYLHRLAVNRMYAGRQLGRHMLQWAHTGIQFEGCDRIRLDCIESNAVLNRFYQECGYKYVGASGGYSRYEKFIKAD